MIEQRTNGFPRNMSHIFPHDNVVIYLNGVPSWFLMDACCPIIHIINGYFTDAGTIIPLSQCPSSTPSPARLPALKWNTNQIRINTTKWRLFLVGKLYVSKHYSLVISVCFDTSTDCSKYLKKGKCEEKVTKCARTCGYCGASEYKLAQKHIATQHNVQHYEKTNPYL